MYLETLIIGQRDHFLQRVEKDSSKKPFLTFSQETESVRKPFIQKKESN